MTQASTPPSDSVPDDSDNTKVRASPVWIKMPYQTGTARCRKARYLSTRLHWCTASWMVRR